MILNDSEWREAVRACKGMTLRKEIYELDVDALEEGTEKEAKLFSTAFHNCQMKLLQPLAENRHAVFHATESEAITYHYELDFREQGRTLQPDPRISHTLTLSIDDYGQPQQVVAVAYPRVHPFEEDSNVSVPLPGDTVSLIREVQAKLHLSYTENIYTNNVDDERHYRLPLSCEIKTYELTGIRPDDTEDRSTVDPWDDIYFTPDELQCFQLSAEYPSNGETVVEIPYHQLPDRISPQKRLVEQTRTLFFMQT